MSYKVCFSLLATIPIQHTLWATPITLRPSWTSCQTAYQVFASSADTPERRGGDWEEEAPLAFISSSIETTLTASSH